jgi:hypothetical protein
MAREEGDRVVGDASARAFNVGVNHGETTRQTVLYDL